MEIHTMIFVHEYGPALGTYPISLSETASFIDAARRSMDMRFATANANPACIAAFWYVNGEMKRFQFNRA